MQLRKVNICRHETLGIARERKHTFRQKWLKKVIDNRRLIHSSRGRHPLGRGMRQVGAHVGRIESQVDFQALVAINGLFVTDDWIGPGWLEAGDCLGDVLASLGDEADAYDIVGLDGPLIQNFFLHGGGRLVWMVG